MYPDHESQANAFDDAYERRQNGDDQQIDDPELQELLNLASRLESELPDDIPDPAFREHLKHQLLTGSETEPYEEPVDLGQERWYRRLVATPWRASVAAASLVAVLLVAVLLGMGPFVTGDDDEDDALEELPFQAINEDDSLTLDGEDHVDQATTLDDALFTDGDDWIAASFPPFSRNYVVLPPLLAGFGLPDRLSEPDVEVNGAEHLLHGADIPDQSSVYYFSAPPDPETMLTTLRGALNLDGELDNDDEVYRLVNDQDETIMLWDPATAFFQFSGDAIDEPVLDEPDDDANADEIAYRFLELIGFDLYTIQYGQDVMETEEGIEVHISPMDLPETALELSLGGHVLVGDDGTIQEAHLHWLSLIEMRDVSLRPIEEILGDIERDDGFTPPVDGTEDSLELDVSNVHLIHVLTRQENSAFILQPAIKLAGEFVEDVSAELPGPARYLVPAANGGD